MASVAIKGLSLKTGLNAKNANQAIGVPKLGKMLPAYLMR
jgi:hypothetical protein